MSLREFIADLRVPAGADQTPTARAGTAWGHCLLGASLGVAGAWLGAPAWAAAAVLVIAYWLVKEVADLRLGGGLADSVIDAGMVGLGAATVGLGAAPLILLAAGVVDGVWGKRARQAD